MKHLVFTLATLLIAACSGGPDGVEKGNNDDSNGDDNNIVVINNAACGNGVVDDGEVCDGDDLDGSSCGDLGFGDGDLACASNCKDFDRRGCGAPDSCGDDMTDGVELCDGTDLAGESCGSLGFGAGSLTCEPNCGDFDTSMCGPPPSCGNGDVDEIEVCDGEELGGATCSSLGLGSGDLACASDCMKYDRSGCSEGCTPDCSSVDCGPDPDCGSDCGGCGDAEQCTGAGVCVCVPVTCEEVGAECGSVDDGCGGMLDCGGCPGAQTCGADGDANTCGCEPVTDGGTVSVDVPVVDVTFDITIGGQALTTSNTTADDEGGLVLQDAQTGERITLASSYDDGALAVAYPLDRRLVPGVYDIYYYNQDPGPSWPINENNLVMAGVDLTTSRTVTVDVPAVEVTFDLTIGGAALTDANTSADDEGGLLLVDPDTGETITLPSSYDDGALQVAYPATRRIVPGTYDIYYYNQDQGDSWPINQNNLVMAGVDLTTSKTVTVDVPVVDVTFDLTIGGQALTEANTRSDDEGGLLLVDPDTGETITLPSSYDDGALQIAYPVMRRIVPGIYDVYYYNQDPGPSWPINENNLVMEGLDLTTSKTVTVDVDVVDVTFDVTIGGQALSVANTTADDEGGLLLVDPDTGETITLPSSYDDGALQIAYPVTRRIVPGTYDVYYYNQDQGGSWPINENNLVMAGVDLTSSRNVTVDIPVVDVTFDLTIGGQALSDANTTSDDEGGLILVDPDTGEQITLPSSYDDGQLVVAYPADRRLVPGVYDVYYYNQDPGPFWPINVNNLVMEGVDLTTSQTLVVDVPVVELTFDLTLGGQALGAGNTTSADEGGLTLVDPDTGEAISLPSSFDDGNLTIAYPVDRRLVPGTYDVYYYNQDAGPSWPVNANKLLTCFTAR